MKKMLLKISIAFAVLLGLLLLNQYKVKKEEKATETEDKGKKMVTVNLESLHRIVIESPKGKVVLEKREKNSDNAYTDEFAFLDQENLLVSEWLVVEPFRDIADRTMIQALQTNLEALESNKVIQEDGKNAADYKLDKPAISVSFFEKDKDQPIEALKIGGENSAASHFYAQTLKQPRIVLIDKTIEYNTSKNPTDWRTKGVLNFKDANSVKKIQLTYASPVTAFEFVRGDDGWQMEKPKKIPANEMMVDGLLREINGLQLKSIVSENKTKDAAKYGLSKPIITVSTFEKDDQYSKTFFVGKVDAKAGSAYVARADTNRIYEVVPTVKDNLTKSVNDFISRRAFFMKSTEMESAQILEKDRTIDLVKKDDTWIQSKDKDVAGATAFTGIFKMQNLEATEYVGTTYPKLPKTADLTLIVRSKEGAETLSLYADKAKKSYAGKQEKTGLYYRFAEKDVIAIQNAVKALLGEPVDAPVSEENHDHGLEEHAHE